MGCYPASPMLPQTRSNNASKCRVAMCISNKSCLSYMLNKRRFNGMLPCIPDAPTDEE